MKKNKTSLLSKEFITKEKKSTELIGQKNEVEENKESVTINNINDVQFGERFSGMPNSDENGKQPENFFFDMGEVKLMNGTTIYFNSPVYNHSVDRALYLLKIVNQNIMMYEFEYPDLKGKLYPRFIINSGGGSVVEGLRLYDSIKNNIYGVTTIVQGMAASMGIILAVSGARKTATPHSTLMIHQLSAGAGGKYAELKDYMKFWSNLQDKLSAILVENTKIKKDKINELMSRESFIMADEALSLGLIDDIITNV